MMKQCTKCGEWNGENRDTCFQCGNALPVSPGYQKICTRCNAIYSAKATNCERCGSPLAVYQDPCRSSTGAAGGGEAESLRWWMVAAAIIWPIVGIVGGLIMRSRGDDGGTRLLKISLITIAAAVGAGLLFGGCSVVFG